MARVLRCEAPDGIAVAVKVLHPRYAGDPQTLERFHREARVLAQLDEPHIVRVLGTGESAQGLPFIAMELLSGSDLRTYIAGLGHRPSASYMLSVARQIALALREAHARGIVHRDIKPSNVILLGDPAVPVVKLVDFGVAIEPDAAKRLTGPETLLGTVEYASPEQFATPDRVDARTDLWSIGVLLYRCLAGRLPFHAASPAGVPVAIAHTEPEPLRQHNQDVPASVETLVERLLVKSPAHRLGSADALIRAIDACELLSEPTPEPASAAAPTASALAAQPLESPTMVSLAKRRPTWLIVVVPAVMVAMALLWSLFSR
jgi:eukaryotic-like serine/threonine-protein kinase